MIIFKKITYKNFLSTGNVPTTVLLNKHNLVLISGTNGKGKSLITDAICFALYGRAYRNINKPLLVNSVNQKQCVVEIEFDVGKKNYLIKRGIKPNILEMYENGNLINQDPTVKDYQKVLEQQILKMNFRAFSQVVVMGLGIYTPFMRLKPNERREFIEDLLDIRVFSTMATINKERMKTIKEELSNIDTEIKLAKEKFMLQENFIKKQKQNQEIEIDKINEEINIIQDEIDTTQEKVNDALIKVDLLQSKTDKFEGLDEKLSEVRLNAKNVKKQIDSFLEEKLFYSSIDECPQCKQGIGTDHRTHIVSTVESKIKEHEDKLVAIDSELQKLTAEYAIWEDLLSEISTINNSIASHNKTISVNTAVISNKRKQIIDIQNNTGDIDDDTKRLKELAKQIVELNNRRKEITEVSHYQSAVALMLNDAGIKAKIIKQYIPLINKLVNKYLDALDLFISFNLDEQFNEVVKSRHRDNFTYESFSAGQKMRIDLALLFAWRDVAKSKNSVNTNLLFFDEIGDSGLDTDGAELFMKLLKMQKNSNIFVISHRDSMFDKFDHHIKVDMVGGFTELS